MKLSFAGLTPMPSQVWGAVRLVPLVREAPREDLRLARRAFPEATHGRLHRARRGLSELQRFAWVPHSLVMRSTPEGSEVARGAQLEAGLGEAPRGAALMTTPRLSRGHQLRILPLHLAMEGLLLLHYDGPEIAWPEYSRQVLRFGLSPRVEWSVTGWDLPDLSDALGLFELVEGQVGVLVFVGDALASAFVAPHPDDYRALHGSLIEDHFGEMLYWYGQHATPPELRVQLQDARVQDLATLRAELERATRAHADFQAWMATGLVERELEATRLRRLGRFTLKRFITRFQEDAPEAEEQHIGEVVLRDDGRVEYLKTYRLSPSQVRRARILKHLAACDWHFVTAYRTWRGGGRLDTVMKREGLGYLLDPVKVKAAVLAWRREQEARAGDSGA
ncbi:MAG: hypothetical protein H6741_10165 [Alphaproteobacteria bacterium]|nr:hypothetical protein [Alphaproteobacteria bacterium]